MDHESEDPIGQPEGEAHTPFRLEITDLQAGWMSCSVTIGFDRLELCVSYLSDAPELLARAIAAVLDGKSYASCRWMDEPGEYRWVFAREGKSVRLRILRFDETYSRQEDDQGALLLEAICDPYRVAKEVRDQLRSLRSRFTPAGYHARWRYPFPEVALQELERLIALKRPPQHLSPPAREASQG